MTYSELAGKLMMFRLTVRVSDLHGSPMIVAMDNNEGVVCEVPLLTPHTFSMDHETLLEVAVDRKELYYLLGTFAETPVSGRGIDHHLLRARFDVDGEVERYE